MKPRLPKLGVEAGVLALMVVMAATLQAQVTGGSLSGTITGSAGAAVANAKISVKNVATDQTVEAESNSAGMYSVPKLAPGDYDVSVSAPGFGVKTERVELAAGARQTLDIALTPASALPQAPAPQAPSLSELGFPATQTRPNPEEQARLDKRTHSAQGASAARVDHRRPHACDGHCRRHGRRQEHQLHYPRCARRPGCGYCRPVFHHRLLRYPGSEDFRNENLRADPPAQGSGLGLA